MSTTIMSIPIEDGVNREAQQLLEELGLDMATAINIFLRQAIREQAIPFAIERYPEKAKTSDAAFFSGANLEHLRRSLAQAKAGQVHQHDLIDVDD